MERLLLITNADAGTNDEQAVDAALDWTRVGGRPLPFDRKSPGPCRGCFMFADVLGRHTGRDATVEVCESE